MSDPRSAGGGVDRRGFFRIVGMGGAAAAAAGCGRTTEAILPYVIPPEHIVPGVAAWFATVCRECPAGCGVLAKSREGRVVKLEGNPDHPVNGGALCARGQAALLGTYDPDRIARPRLREGTTWRTISVDEAQKLLIEKLAAARQAGPGRIAMLTQLESGTLGRLMDEWLKAVGGRPRVAYEPFAHEDLRAASRVAFGLDAIPYHAFEEARVILSLGADFLETWLSPVGYAAGFRRARAAAGVGQRATVFHIEPRYSMTAANADEWLPNIPGTEGAIALALLRLVLEARQHATLPAREVEALAAIARTVEVDAVATRSGVPSARLGQIAEALAARRPSLVVGGGVAVSGGGGTEAALAVHLLNYALGNVGRTVRFGPNAALSRASRYADVVALGRAMAQGEIAVLLVKDANPAFTLPAKTGFAEALGKVPFVVSLSSHFDETTAGAHLVVPDLTPLESWGDYSPREGVWGLLQPAMGPVPKVGPANPDVVDVPALSPVRDALREALRLPAAETFPGVETKATGDLLLDVGRALLPGTEKTVFQAKTFADYLRDSWRALAKAVAPTAPFDEFWEAALRRGGVWSEAPAAKVALQPGLKVGLPGAPQGAADDAALLVVPSARHFDGRSANKVWLHEAPDAMTQVVYGSWAEVSAGTARDLGLQPGDVVRVESPHGAVEAPVIVSATIEARSVAMPLGLGHSEYGRFARGVGQSPYGLLPPDPDPASGGRRWLGVRVRLRKTGRREKLASPAGVSELDHSREIFETVSTAEAAKLEQAGRAPAGANLPSMYPDLKYPTNRWGMSIDLDACTGCQACVVACQAENNVPSVGKGDIDYGRSVQWLRVERWWDFGEPARGTGGHAAGGPVGGAAPAAEGPPGGRPRARFLPMLCQHCEVAPCEPVCPVFAAYHTSDGLNAQIYNRCVGTRYCGNNCPYMVRRFNWYRYEWPAPLNLQLNPDVAVRDRGVMEKCTMCVQRIIAGRDRARDEGRAVRDGDILTACQQTCPTQAITFGDLKDGLSRVSRLSASPRGYHVLGELGTRPAVTYLKKIVREEPA
jgi:anaerobic selenocysteine-containing dehydrogenase/Fe-S-cluster-containing dehydrogenase component